MKIISVTLGALATGTVLGWSAPASLRITTGNEYGFNITSTENAWVGSISTLGAACVCVIIGFIMDAIGRKLTMLLLVIPFLLGWILVIWATSLDMLLAGRFILGFAGGAFCVSAPTYTSEIAQDDIRGTLGTFFQLLLVIGILYTYAIGSYVKVFVLSILCGILPIIFAIVFFFMPETPYYLVKANKIDEAARALVWLRGSQYDTETELKQIEEKVNDAKSNPEPLLRALSKKTAIKALIITYCIMFFQQFSGINAVLFNTTEIFKSAGASISPEVATIIIGVIQVVATFISTIVIEKLGRRILLLSSAVMMCICGVALGVFFYLKYKDNPDLDLIESISWLPLVSLCIFIVAFSVGFGPIPWIVASELCTPNIKGFVSSSGGTFNWILAFIVTKTFLNMREGLGEGGPFWLFAGITLLGAIFVFIFLPETKGKSIDEIQVLLGGETNVSEKK